MFSVWSARAQVILKRIKSQIVQKFPAPNLADDPSNPRAWLALAEQQLSTLPDEAKALMVNHGLSASSPTICFFQSDIKATAGKRLSELADQPMTPAIIATALDEIIRRKTILQCTYAHRAGAYYDNAEAVMATQWDVVIWPIIKDEDFSSTLELACGHGRNTEYLRKCASSIDLIDVNRSCLEACKKRFGQSKDGCSFRYHLTDGDGLTSIASSSISFGYSWDSMVHFDKLVIRDYVAEFFRVLKPGGTAFLHHSNYGAVAPNSDWAKNHGGRSDMTGELMHEYAREAGLAVKFQRLSGMSDGWGLDELDCLTLLHKPS